MARSSENRQEPRPGEWNWVYTPHGSERSWTFRDIAGLFGGNEHIAQMLCALLDGQEPEDCLRMWESAGIIKTAPREDSLVNVPGEGDFYIFANPRYANREYLLGYMPELPDRFANESRSGYKIVEAFRREDGQLDVLAYRRGDDGETGYVIGYGYDPDAGEWERAAHLGGLGAAAEAWAEVTGKGSYSGRDAAAAVSMAEDIKYELSRDAEDMIADIMDDLGRFVESLPEEARESVARQGHFHETLTEDASPAVRSAVAETTEHGWRLAELSDDSEPSVRMAVAKRGFDLNGYAFDPDPAIRAIAAAGNISREGLMALADDPDPDVRSAALNNPLYEIAVTSAEQAEERKAALRDFKVGFPAAFEDARTGYIAAVRFPGVEESEHCAVDYYDHRGELVLSASGHIPDGLNGNPLLGMDDIAAIVNLNLLAIDPDATIPRLDSASMRVAAGDASRGKMTVAGETSRILRERDLQELVHTTGVFAQDKAPVNALQMKPVGIPKGKPAEKKADTLSGDMKLAAGSSEARRTVQDRGREQRKR